MNIDDIRAAPPGEIFETVVNSIDKKLLHELETTCYDYYGVTLNEEEDRVKIVARRRCASNPHPGFLEVCNTDSLVCRKRQRYIIYVIANSQDSFATATTMYESHPWARVVFMPTTMYLESYMYMSVLPRLRREWDHADMVGCIAWSAHTKQPRILTIPLVCDEALSRGANTAAFLYRGDPLISTAEKWHPGFRNVWRAVLKKYGWIDDVVLNDSIPSFYANYWATSSKLMHAYCTFILNVAHDIENNRDLDTLLWADASYSSRGSDVAKLPPSECMRIWGVPYYTFHPFVFERLACFWLSSFSSKIHAIS